MIRCVWAEGNEQLCDYHDTEWGVPQRNDRILFEYILLDSFQAGLNWAIMLQKRENFRKAFDNFNPQKIAAYDKRKLNSLLKDSGIIRHRGKIEAAKENARVFLALQDEFGSFAKYLWGWVDEKTIKNRQRREEDIPAQTDLSDRISKDLKSRGFRFFGATICYAFLQGAGVVNDHLVSCFRYREV